MFYITISNGLLKDGHRKRMGSAVWEFMWLLDKVTKIDDKGDGWVMGGKPVLLKEVAEQTDVDEETVSRNLIHLEVEGYIQKIRTPRGLSIRVRKAKKRFHKNVESDSTKVLNPVHISVESNIRHSNDKVVRHREPSAPDVPFNFSEYTKEMQLSTNRAMRIIAAYFVRRRVKFTNEAQVQKAIKRHVRAANDLVPFESDKIKAAMRECEEMENIDWTLETVLKVLTK